MLFQAQRRVLSQGACPLASRHIPKTLFATYESRRPISSCSSITATSAPSSVGINSSTSLTITAPDDWHLHVRDGKAMASVVPHTAQHYRRAIIMPNLTPPVTTAQAAIEYRQRILACVPPSRAPFFQPLMTCYLTDRTTPEEVEAAKEAGVIAFKLYPAGATTNSDSGVTDILKVVNTLKHMAHINMPLLVHGEVTDPSVDMFDREAVFIHTKLIPLLDQVPDLKVVMEHITTKDAAEFVASAPPNIAATVTPQHMLLNRNALFTKGLRPHNFCLPILKREKHRDAVAEKATSGSPKFFLGTDSAPHPKGAKESACGCAGMYSAPISLGLYATAFEAAGRLSNLEAFASFNGPRFYGLPPNEGTITLVKQPLLIPDHYSFGDGVVVPMWAGEEVSWQVLAGAADSRSI